MSERPVLRIVRPDVPVTAVHRRGWWTLEARLDPWWVRLTTRAPLTGELARSAAFDARYLSIHVDDWEGADLAPVAHAEWHGIAEAIARFEGAPLPR